MVSKNAGMLGMRRTVHIITWLLLLIIGAKAEVCAQTSSSLHKSFVGIEVHFPFDKAQLDLDYMGNRSAFKRFAHTLDSIGLQRIDSVVIISQSSPEGVYEHNLKLSRRRAATMRRAIEQRHPDLKGRLYVHADGESWQLLREYVKNDRRMKQKTINQVLRIIDSDVNLGTKKWRLAQLPIYRYLRMTYFPRIRNSVFCIVYFDPAQMPMAVLPAPVAASALPESLTAVPPTTVKHTPTPLLAIKSNLLYDLGTVLNVGVEYFPRNSHWSFAAHYTFPWWSIDKQHLYLQALDGQLEARRYFKGNGHYAGHYLSAYAHANLYDLSFDAERAWQGEGWGAGLSYGYAWRIGKTQRWRIEAFVKAGYYQTLFDPYHASDPYNGKYYYDWEGMPEDFIPRNYRTRWLGPTGAGVTLSYDLFSRKIKN